MLYLRFILFNSFYLQIHFWLAYFCLFSEKFSALKTAYCAIYIRIHGKPTEITDNFYYFLFKEE